MEKIYFYARIAYLQFEEDTAEFDEMQDKGDYAGILRAAAEYDYGDAIDLEEVYTSPERYRGDDLLDEDEHYAVTYNNRAGGIYAIFRKCTEADIAAAVQRYGITEKSSDAVKIVANKQLKITEMEKYDEREYRGYKVEIYYDSDYANPRKDWDCNLATFVCEHDRYDLGDGQDMDEAIRDLTDKYVKCRAAIDYFKRVRGAEEIEEDGNKFLMYKYKDWQGLYRDEYIDIYEDDEYSTTTSILEMLTRTEKLELIEESGEVFIMPISIYDHSGITMWIGSVDGRCDSRWDCGCVGFAYLEKSKVLENTVCKGDWRPKALDIMEAEMKVYDSYLRGDVYGYVLRNEEGDEIDSCWGYFGDKSIEDAMPEIHATVDREIEKREGLSLFTQNELSLVEY